MPRTAHPRSMSRVFEQRLRAWQQLRAWQRSFVRAVIERLSHFESVLDAARYIQNQRWWAFT
jgi:hypothetical protein